MRQTAMLRNSLSGAVADSGNQKNIPVRRQATIWPAATIVDGWANDEYSSHRIESGFRLHSCFLSR
jgi:hypothetical protein